MNLYLNETGINNDEIIIFLHPEMLSSWIWEKQSIEFSDYHCIMLDLPAHGKSQIKTNFTIKNSSKEIMNLIEKKSQGGPVHLVGISLGAQIILDMISQYEDNIKTAILVNPLLADYNNYNKFKESLNQVLNSYLPVKDSKFFIKAYIRYYGIPKSNFENLYSSINKINDNNLYDIMNQTLIFNLDNKIKNKTPLLILAGDKEYDNIKQSAKIIKEKTQNSQAYIVPKMLKLANITNTDIFNLILRNYLEEKPLPNNLIKL